MAKTKNDRELAERYKNFSALGCAARERIAAEKRARGEFPVEYCRLSLGDEAYEYTKGMTRKEFTEFVSRAILRQAKREGMEV